VRRLANVLLGLGLSVAILLGIIGDLLSDAILGGWGGEAVNADQVIEDDNETLSPAVRE
jgi:hypothetical protein